MPRLRTVSALSLAIGAALAHADPVDAFVAQKMAADHLPGVVFAVIDPDGKVATREYGFANLEKQEKFTVESVHRIASLSKQMCSYVALCLAKEGKLSLDDEVLKWFPQGPESWRGMRVRHLMGHTSGIPDPEGFDYAKEYTLDAYIALIGKAPLETAPGMKFRYNNYAYGLLGALVERAGGSPLPVLAKKLIFDPVGMTGTGYYTKGTAYPHEVIGYRWQDGRFVIPTRERPQLFNGSGGVHSTLADMVKYELALRGGKLDRSILAQQWTQSFPEAGNYGFGWYVDPGAVRHTGTTFGYTSAYYRERSDGWAVILFRNSDTGSQMEMALAVLDLWKAQVSAQSKH